MEDDPVQVKFERKVVDPCENSRAVHISPHNPGTVKHVQLTRIESRPWAFQRAINQGRASPLTSPDWGLNIQICRFLQKFRLKAIKSLLQSFIVYNFQRHGCSTINYPSNGIDIFTGNEPVPVKFGPKGTDPQ